MPSLPVDAPLSRAAGATHTEPAPVVRLADTATAAVRILGGATIRLNAAADTVVRIAAPRDPALSYCQNDNHPRATPRPAPNVQIAGTVQPVYSEVRSHEPCIPSR